MRIILLLCTFLMVLLAAASKFVGGESAKSHDMDEYLATCDSGLFADHCRRLPGPWITQYFLPVKANVRTTVEIAAESSMVKFVLFDGVLDRSCVLAFTTQPEFWELAPSSDSCLALPMPLLPSGIYHLTLSASGRVYSEKWVVMK